MGAVSVVQTKHLIREFLLRQSSVTDLVGQGIYGTHLSDADAGTVLQHKPIMILELDSGNMRWHGAVEVQYIDFWSYSKNSGNEAAQVYDAVASVLQHERLIIPGIDLTCITREVERPQDGYNSHLDAWYIRGRWAVEGV